MRIFVLLCVLCTILAFRGNNFLLLNQVRSSTRILSTQLASSPPTIKSDLPVCADSNEPIYEIRPTITDKARTITHICTSGTLCTIASGEELTAGAPFGSYVDYMLDEKGWPVLLLSTQSIHTQNVLQNPSVSLFCQLPRASAQSAVALSRVTVMGKVEAVPTEDLAPLKLAFTLVHQYAEQIVESPRFSFYRIKPEKIFFAGGFGVQSTWVDVEKYEEAKADVMANEVSAVLSKVNTEKQAELSLLCKHFLSIEKTESVRIQAIDRLGIDLRVKQGEYTDEYRIGFRYQVNSAEDAKSEMVKLFQEAWERDNGYSFTDSLPPFTKYAEDILRSDKAKALKK